MQGVGDQEAHGGAQHGSCEHIREVVPVGGDPQIAGDRGERKPSAPDEWREPVAVK